MKINVLLILFLLLLFAVFALAIIKKQKSVIMLAIIVLALIIGITGIYLFNIPFRDNVNIKLKPTDRHMYIVDNKVYYLPLPSKTTLKYRTSDESAVYITKSELDKIVTLYRNISNDDTFTESQDNNRVVLLFKYNNCSFCISIEAYSKSKKVFVDMVCQGDVLE